MKIEPKANCPLDGFKPCRQLECAWFMEVHGANPNTGEPIKDWGCSMTMIPMMLIENAKQQHSTASAVESFRNEMVKAQDMSHQILLHAANNKTQSSYILEGDK